MTPALDDADIAAYESAVQRTRTREATRIVELLLDKGVPATEVLLGVIGEVQRRVGERWQTGSWSVPQEHAATAIAMSAAETVLRRLEDLPARRGKVLIACPDQEWHVVPAALTAGVLRAHGWDVTTLGASTPAARLGRFLHDRGPDVTGVSCSVLRSLPAARRFIEASTSAGIPVLAGGAAFGSDPRRAHQLGATAWAPDALAALEALEQLPPVVPPAPALDRGALAEQALLATNHERIAEASVAQSPASLEQDLARDIVNELLWAVGAALVTGDERTVSDTERWIEALLAARSIGSTHLEAVRDDLADRLAEFPRAARLLRSTC